MSRARFESKLMLASTAYRVTVYRHQYIDLNRTCRESLEGKTESALKDQVCITLNLNRFHMLICGLFAGVLAIC